MAVDLVALLAYWYIHRQMCVCWKTVLSELFFLGNGSLLGKAAISFLVFPVFGIIEYLVYKFF